MALKAVVFVCWAAVLVVANAWVIGSEWAQLVFTGVTAGLMTYALGLVDRRRGR